MILLVTRLAFVTVAAVLLQQLMPGFSVQSWAAATIFALGLGICNAAATPLFDRVRGPFWQASTLMFWVHANAAIFYWVGGAIAGVTVADGVTALAGALVVGTAVWAATATTRSLLLRHAV